MQIEVNLSINVQLLPNVVCAIVFVFVFACMRIYLLCCSGYLLQHRFRKSLHDILDEKIQSV